MIQEIQRITELKKSHKEKLFLIQVALFGSAEDLKEVSNQWIEQNIFTAAKYNSPNSKVQIFNLSDSNINAQVYLN